MSRDVFILGGKRTPMGKYVGALKDVSAIDHEIPREEQDNYALRSQREAKRARDAGNIK